MQRKQTAFILVLSLLWLIGCGGTAVLPTEVPLAQLPTAAPPTSTPLPATIDLTAVYLAQNPTAIPTTPAPVPTATPVDAIINITDPDEGDVLRMGSTAIINGLVEKEETDQIWLTLRSANGRLLAEQPGILNEIGWRTDLPIPIFVSGSAELVATIRTQDGTPINEYRRQVTLEPDPATSDRYLRLYRPIVEDIGVSGFNVFFDGDILFPANNTVSLSIYGDNCQTRIARQNFVLGSSSRPFYWQGFVIAPRDYAGPACAVASFGDPGAENWREAVVPIIILPVDDPNAAGIRIGNPPPDSEFTAGEEIFVYGTAYNISAGELSMSLLMENGRIVEQKTITTDFWGYFQDSINLPIDVEGLGQIIVETGPDDTFADDIRLIRVNPPPTPTPGP